MASNTAGNPSNEASNTASSVVSKQDNEWAVAALVCPFAHVTCSHSLASRLPAPLDSPCCILAPCSPDQLHLSARQRHTHARAHPQAVGAYLYDRGANGIKADHLLFPFVLFPVSSLHLAGQPLGFPLGPPRYSFTASSPRPRPWSPLFLRLAPYYYSISILSLLPVSTSALV